MGILDALYAQTPQGEQVRGGLLGMASGLLSGSVGNGGQFAPAMGQGFAGFQGGMQNAQQMQLRQAQMAQQAQYRALQSKQIENEIAQQAEASNFFRPSGASTQPTGSAQAMPVGASGSAPDAAGLDARIQAGLTSPNLQVRKWAQDTMRLRLSQTGGRSAPVPTQDGYAYLDSDGTTKYLTGKGGNPLMPVSALAQDPSRQGEIAQAKKVGGNEADRLLAGQNAAKQNEEAAMLIDQAIGVLPQASSGSFSGGVTMMANAAGISTDASKADAELRLLAGRLTAQQPRFEGPQSDKDIQAYREMAGDLANPNLPIETRLVTARKMKALLDKYGPDGRLKPEPPSGDTQNGGNRPSLSDIF